MHEKTPLGERILKHWQTHHPQMVAQLRKDHQLELSGQSGSFDRFTLEMFAVGGGALPLIGTAEQVAEQIAQLYGMGIDGLLMCFLDYYENTRRFEREISPLLRQMGVIR